jgi:hypothetical protein
MMGFWEGGGAHRIVKVCSDVSEERISSVFRVTVSYHPEPVTLKMAVVVPLKYQNTKNHHHLSNNRRENLET